MSNYTNNFIPCNNTLPPTENPNYKAFLDTVVRNSVILLDADTAMKGAAFEAMMRTFVPLLRKYGKQIIVLQSVMKELRFLFGSTDDREREKATRAIEGLNALAQAGIVCFKGDPNENCTGGVAILKYIMKNIWDEQITVLTQCRKLAEDCKIFAEIKSTKLEHTVQAKRISTLYGQINNFSDTPIPTQDTSVQPFRKTIPISNNATTILHRYGV